MDVKEFIESGVLEEYCLGGLSDEERAFVIQMTLLYPEVKDELARIELFMEKMALKSAIEVSDAGLKDRILNALQLKTEGKLDLDNLPEIGRGTDYKLWLNTLKHLIPAEPERDMMFKLLRKDERITQTLVISKIDVPEETHTDVLESFLVLAGRCRCTIGDYAFEAGAGALIEIPLHLEHHVEVLSPYVVAVLQYQIIG